MVAEVENPHRSSGWDSSESASIERAVFWTDLESGCSTQSCKYFLKVWLNPPYTFFKELDKLEGMVSAPPTGVSPTLNTVLGTQ